MFVHEGGPLARSLEPALSHLIRRQIPRAAYSRVILGSRLKSFDHVRRRQIVVLQNSAVVSCATAAAAYIKIEGRQGITLACLWPRLHLQT